MALLGVSTGLFPDSTLYREDYALLSRYPIDTVELGYEHVAPALDDPHRRDRLRALVRHGHPPVRSLHAPYRPERDISVLDEERRRRAVAHLEATFALAAELEIDLVVLHASEESLAADRRPARCTQARRSLDGLAAKARSLGLRLAVETMPPEWLPAGLVEIAALTRDLDADTIGFCLDTNHANLTGDLPAIVRALGPRLWNVHISDNDGIRQRHWLPFRGVIDWPALVSSLAAVRYTGPLVYELDPHPAGTGPALAEIEANFAHLEALFPASTEP